MNNTIRSTQANYAAQLKKALPHGEANAITRSQLKERLGLVSDSQLDYMLDCAMKKNVTVRYQDGKFFLPENINVKQMRDAVRKANDAMREQYHIKKHLSHKIEIR